MGEDEEANDSPNNFNNKSVWARISVIAAGPVFNAANELAVKKFLQEKIGFLDIYDIIAQSMERNTVIRNPDLEEILAVEDETYKWIESRW